MSISVENEINYAALVIRVPEPFKMPNSDRLFGITVAGSTVIVNDSWKDRVGELAVVFPAESQISEGLATWANLHRHAERNRDQAEVGYLEDHRRVRALKLRGNVSNGLMLPLHEVTGYAGTSDDLIEGAILDTLNGVELCRKYVIKLKESGLSAREAKKVAKAFKRVDEKVFPMHIDTDQYLRNEHLLTDDDVMIVTQKLHGSSVRFGNVPVKVKHNWFERLLSKAGVRLRETEYDLIGGSRKVIKDPNNPNQKHFYGEGNDIWTLALQKWGSAVPKNLIVYGELVGYTPDGGAIQKGFTYDETLNVDARENAGSSSLYVYRVAFVNEDGGLYDLSWDQVRYFCDTRGLNHVPELWRGFKRDFNLEDFQEKAFFKDEQNRYANGAPLLYADRPVPLSSGGTGKDEGVVIRVDRGHDVPLLFKYKNDSFYVHETEELDTGEASIEA